MNNDTYGYGKCLTTPTLMKYLSVGEETAKQIGRQAGATIIIGKKKVIYNRTKVDEYIDKITGGGHGIEPSDTERSADCARQCLYLAG